MNAEERKAFERCLEADRQKTYALNLSDDGEFEPLGGAGLDRSEIFLLKIALLVVKVLFLVFVFGMILDNPMWLVPVSISGLTFWAYKNMSKNFYKKLADKS